MSKISIKKSVNTPELVPVETGDILTIWLDQAGTVKHEIRVVGKTCFGDFPAADRQNYLFGTVIGDPDAIIRLDFKEGIIDYNGSNYFKAMSFAVVEYKDKEIEYDPDNNYRPCKVINKKKFVNVPVCVGDILHKPSRTGDWEVVYVNDKCSVVVVENDTTGKVETINFKDSVSLAAFGLVWG